eukprot:jgi/Psemu1/587/gm1.587_g
MLGKSRTSFRSARNACVKAVLTVVIGVGIACAVVATQSCRWYDLGGGTAVSDTWDFLPSNNNNNNDDDDDNDNDDNTTTPIVVESVGLFCYRPAAADGDDDNGKDNNSGNGNGNGSNDDPTAVFWDSFAGVRYDPPLVGTAHPWTLAAQLCVAGGPVVAFCGWIEAVLSGTGTGLALAAGLQVAGAVAGMSLCDRSMTCPWHWWGGLSNALAAALFAVGCGMLSLLVSVSSEPTTIKPPQGGSGSGVAPGDGSPPSASAAAAAASAAEEQSGTHDTTTDVEGGSYEHESGYGYGYGYGFSPPWLSRDTTETGSTRIGAGAGAGGETTAHGSQDNNSNSNSNSSSSNNNNNNSYALPSVAVTETVEAD